jgi:hypothetical protein
MAADARERWTGMARPWFIEVAAASWTRLEPTVVLTPSRHYGFYLKSLLLAEGIATAGLRFWTPGDCRQFLASRLLRRPITGIRENLHLLLAAAAEQFPENPAAQAVARDPAGLMRALDQLAAAGWSGTELPASPLRDIAGAFSTLLGQLGWCTVQQLDALLARQESTPAIADLLALGFDGSHWDQWFLLLAAVRASARATIGTSMPRLRSEHLDQLWVGALEELYGGAESAPADGDPLPRPFTSLAERMENPQAPDDGLPGATILVGRNARAEAEAIALQAVNDLAGPGCTRLGILFARYGALSREVAAALQRRGIAVNDTIGFNAPPTPEEERRDAWLDLQREPGPDTILRLLDVAPSSAWPPGLTRNQVRDALRRALGEVMVNDPAVIGAYLSCADREDERAVAEWLRRHAVLPDRARLERFLAEARKSADALGWPQLMNIAETAGEAMARSLPGPMAKATFLAWLAGITRAAGRQRDPETNHPFARVHLLTYAQADGQDWSHLILAEMNEGRWPPPYQSAPFLPDGAVEALNAQAEMQGRQGAGHRTVRPGYAAILGPAQRQALVQRQFYNLIEAATCGLTLTASLFDETDPSRRLLPSALLTHLFQAQEGRPLSDAEMENLERRTTAWLAEASPASADTPAPEEIEATREAYTSRRRSGVPFSVYEFALDRPPARPVSLSCRTWERAIGAPAMVWLKIVIGVESDEAMAWPDLWKTAIGAWSHRWLSRAISGESSGTWTRRRPALARSEDVLKAASTTQARIAAAYTAAGRRLPEWWRTGWHEAIWHALRLAELIDAAGDWPYAATEWTLPPRTAFAVGGRSLGLTGRIDLVLSDGAQVAGSDCWVIDHKTGSVRALSSTRFAEHCAAKGTGMQIALYALALHALGAKSVAASILTPAGPLKSQLGRDDILACAPLWEGLAAMQDTGIFGMRGEVRPEFGRGSSYPLAVLPVDPDLLEEKWMLTHPKLAPEEAAPG